MLALLLAASVVGGRVYAARVDAGGAQIAVFRYAGAGVRSGPPVLLIPELGFDHRLFDLDGAGLARGLQARGREVFTFDWRGTGRSGQGIHGAGGLEALLGGDAPAALAAALEATGAPCAQIVGVGLGGAAAYLLKSCAVVAVSVPARYEVPNEAAGRLIAAAKKNNYFSSAPGTGGPAVALGPWAELPSPLDLRERTDLFSLLLVHGDDLGRRERPLRAGLGSVSPELARDVVRWMEAGDLDLPAGPLLPAAKLSEAIAGLKVPLLVIAAPRDNLVHPEHAVPQVKHDFILLSRIEGYPEDAGHLALAAPWAGQLYAEIASWLASH